MAERDTDVFPRDLRGFSVFPKVPGKRPVPLDAPGPVPVPRVSGAFLDVWDHSRGSGTARPGGQNKEEEGAGLRLIPPCQGHRRGGAASFPRIGLSAPGAGRRSSSPVPLPCSGRPPKAE